MHRNLLSITASVMLLILVPRRMVAASGDGDLLHASFIEVEGGQQQQLQGHDEMWEAKFIADRHPLVSVFIVQKCCFVQHTRNVYAMCMFLVAVAVVSACFTNLPILPLITSCVFKLDRLPERRRSSCRRREMKVGSYKALVT